MDTTPPSPNRETDGAIETPEGNFRPHAIPTGNSRGRAYQPGSTRMGELLQDRQCEPMLPLCPRLGGEEDPATLDASTKAQGVRLEAVE